MKWNIVKSNISSVAPNITMVLSGPWSSVAENALMSVFNLNEGNTEADIIQAISKATPEQIAALKQADIAFKKTLSSQGVSIESISVYEDELEFRRERERADMWTSCVLAFFIVGIFAMCAWMCFQVNFSDITSAQAAILGGIMGYASSKADLVAGFFYGSSAQYKGEKTNTNNTKRV